MFTLISLFSFKLSNIDVFLFIIQIYLRDISCVVYFLIKISIDKLNVWLKIKYIFLHIFGILE